MNGQFFYCFYNELFLIFPLSHVRQKLSVEGKQKKGKENSNKECSINDHSIPMISMEFIYTCPIIGSNFECILQNFMHKMMQ